MEKPEYENLTIMTAARRYNDWMYDLIRPYLGKNVLEIGSGFGTFSEMMVKEDRQVTGLDINSVHVEEARQKNIGAEFVLHDIASGVGPLPGKTFDTVVSLHVFEHIPNDEAALKNAVSLLDDTGKVVIMVPAHPWVYGELDRMAGHQRRYTKQAARGLLEHAGLTIIHQQWLNPWSLPAMWWTSRIRRAPQLSYSSVQMYDRLVPIFRTIERIFPMPIGQALFLVGQKKNV